MKRSSDDELDHRQPAELVGSNAGRQSGMSKLNSLPAELPHGLISSLIIILKLCDRKNEY